MDHAFELVDVRLMAQLFKVWIRRAPARIDRAGLRFDDSTHLIVLIFFFFHSNPTINCDKLERCDLFIGVSLRMVYSPVEAHQITIADY